MVIILFSIHTHTHSHGQKYQHPRNCVKKFNPSVSNFLHFNWLHVWLLYCPHLLLATGVSKYKLQEHHLLEKQFLTILTRCQSFLSSPFFCSVWNFIKQVWLFFSVFCVVAVQTKTISTWYQTFAIGTILWDKCWIFDRIARVPIFWPWQYIRVCVCVCMYVCFCINKSVGRFQTLSEKYYYKTSMLIPTSIQTTK